MNEKIMTAGRVAILALGVAALAQTMYLSHSVVAALQAPTPAVETHTGHPEQDATPVALADRDVLLVAAQIN